MSENFPCKAFRVVLQFKSLTSFSVSHETIRHVTLVRQLCVKTLNDTYLSSDSGECTLLVSLD